MKTPAVLNNSAAIIRNSFVATGIATAVMFGSTAYADDYACVTVAEKEVAVEAAKLKEDWGEIFTAQAALMTAKTECYIDENMTKDNAEDKWADIKTDFKDGMNGLQDEFDEQVDNATDTYEDAKDQAKTDEALAQAEQAYNKAMENITDSYNRSVTALKDKLGIDQQ